MLRLERQDEILELLRQRHSMTVEALAKMFFVSTATIRRDLDMLERENLIKRTYGGAVLLEGRASESPLLLRENENVTAKEEIARLATSFVSDNSIIMMDSSSTVLRMVPRLAPFEHLTCITHGLKTALAIHEIPGITIHCLGGKLQDNTLSLTGSSTCKRIDELNAELAILSCRGFSISRGMTEASEDEAQIKRSMMASAKRTILLCDNSKFEVMFLETVCPPESLHAIVTDQKPSFEIERGIIDRGIKLLYPEI